MIRITADSTCDLPQSILEQYNIAITPLGVIKGDGLFHDNVDITIDDIAAHVASGGDITTTNAVNLVDYHTFFQEQLKGYEGLVHINLGMEFSSCHQNALLAASELENVVAVDSANLSVGHGLLVLLAAQAARNGATSNEIIALIEDYRPRLETSFVLDTLDYMKKGGRCSSVLALGANLLKLHPCIEVINGKMTVTKKYRGSLEKVLPTYVKDRLEGRDDLDKRFVYMADCCSGETSHLMTSAHDTMEHLHIFEQILTTRIGCTIFCHCGPNTVGFVVLKA